MRIERLYDLANNNGIIIEEGCPEKLISLSMSFPDKSMLIALSKLTMAPKGTTRLECFAHELGHCMTGSFYKGYSPLELRAKHEYTADKWAVKKLIPFSALIRAGKEGCRERYEFAEYFGVSESFIQKAIKYHASMGNILPQDNTDL